MTATDPRPGEPATSPPACAVRVFSADLDGTLLGDPAATHRFRRSWDARPVGARPMLVYNSGRSVADVHTLITRGELPTPAYVIGGVGTELYDWQRRTPVAGFTARFAEAWAWDRVAKVMSAVPGVALQPAAFLNPFKSSWYLRGADPGAVGALRRRFRQAGLDVEVIYSSGRDLDVVPRHAGKGNALAWLCARLRVPLAEVLVAGDSGNDTAMFLAPGTRGIVVRNARPELLEAVARLSVFVCTRPAADGVVEGLRHFGVL